ncbi:alpha-L-fucosidase [Boudabousia tangfeifanii]|uniref:alpha-L-fucosidase n=1 Tax=Boudabousia tangfeifanii TaxID=1912795 RepID=A0A1D9MLM5_9ACTO|nr:alpha-L-fucosidase [Boudabousia tangfeifanii]AOZ73202.1 alpha-L-fucosidase [Boudabousia tangfeifanii]
MPARFSSPGFIEAPWFDAGRFGLFVHFGLYSVAARHEWVMTREKTQVSDYEQLTQAFDPDLFDARKIARAAKAAGMSYAVLTTKHHEGFCLFDSQLTDYTAPKVCGRDLVREWVEALRAEGLKVGCYYSLVDWHHPDFTIDFNHPRRDDPDAREQNEQKNWGRYREYLHAQVRELLTNYGKLDYLFFDFSYPWEVDGWVGKGRNDWDSDGLLAMCRQLQPGMIVNDRLDLEGDLVTPEQYQPTSPMLVEGEPARWEACQTLNGSWGYDRDNTRFKSTEMILQMLADTVSKNGNLLLNIGPDGRGNITPHDRKTLQEIAEWMELHQQAIIGAGQTSHPEMIPAGMTATQRGNRLYLFLDRYPFGHLHLPNSAEKVSFARFLHDGSQIQWEQYDPEQEALTTEPGGQPAGTLSLRLPTKRPEVALPVIELFLK